MTLDARIGAAEQRHGLRAVGGRLEQRRELDAERAVGGERCRLDHLERRAGCARQRRDRSRSTAKKFTSCGGGNASEPPLWNSTPDQSTLASTLPRSSSAKRTVGRSLGSAAIISAYTLGRGSATKCEKTSLRAAGWSRRCRSACTSSSMQASGPDRRQVRAARARQSRPAAPLPLRSTRMRAGPLEREVGIERRDSAWRAAAR